MIHPFHPGTLSSLINKDLIFFNVMRSAFNSREQFHFLFKSKMKTLVFELPWKISGPNLCSGVRGKIGLSSVQRWSKTGRGISSFGK